MAAAADRMRVQAVAAVAAADIRSVARGVAEIHSETPAGIHSEVQATLRARSTAHPAAAMYPAPPSAAAATWTRATVRLATAARSTGTTTRSVTPGARPAA